MARVAFYSTNAGLPWGGSEHLWSRAAHRLLKRGHAVSVSYKHWPDGEPEPLQRLREAGARVHLRRAQPLWKRLGRRLARKALRNTGATGASRRFSAEGAAERWLEHEAPDLVLVTVSYHTDALPIAAACRRRGIPYALNLQCASRRDSWPADDDEQYRRAYTEAARCFFLSAENRHIIEDKIAAPLPQAAQVPNPLGVRPDAPLPWPSPEEGWRLACVGRLHFRSKGQDTILRVLRREKWRGRPLRVAFFGRDQGNREQLEALIRRYDLEEQARYAGFEDPEVIWRAHHGLLLPSRYEGMPMVTPEAMTCGRVPIVTRCGRNPDLVADGDTGFLAEAATERLVDRALERAWQRRSEWKKMGRRAAQHIREDFEDDPPGAFARRLLDLLS